MNIVKDSLYINPGQSHKLVTHEDSRFLHLHKILGGMALGNYIYRLCMFVRYGTMNFDTSYSTLFWIAVHAMLHVSSFEFHLPQRRNKVYNIIWPEMRWHSMFFAYRSAAMMFLLWLSWRGFLAEEAAVFVRGPVVLLTMATTDAVTSYYKIKDQVGDGETTMRSNPYPSYVSPAVARAYNLFYSTSQVFATMNILCRNMSAIFLVMFPIQIAPFGMTLVKKGIINQAGWHLWYSLALLLNYWYGFLPSNSDIPAYYKWSVLLFCIMRFRFHMNKYALWSAVIATQWYLVTTQPEIYLDMLDQSRIEK